MAMSVPRSVRAALVLILACSAYHVSAEPPDAGAAPWELARWSEWPRWLQVPVLRGHDYALPALTDGLLRHTDAAVRARCAFLLGQVGSSASAPCLALSLRDADRNVRIFSGIALGLLGDERGLPAARAALIGTRWWVRYYALVALWQIGGDRAEAAVKSALNDQDPLVRAAARGALNDAPPSSWAERTAYGLDEELSLEQFVFDAANYLVGESDLWFHRGEYEQLLRCQEAAVFLDPTFVEMFEVNGWLYWSMERNTEAIGAYRRGIEANPESWEAAFALGFHYFNVGDYEKALPYLARAQELGAAPIMLHTYAHALEKAGRVEDSLREWEYLRKLEPDSHIPPQQIERLLKRQGMGNGGGGRREAGSWKRRTAGDSSRS